MFLHTECGNKTNSRKIFQLSWYSLYHSANLQRPSLKGVLGVKKSHARGRDFGVGDDKYSSILVVCHNPFTKKGIFHLVAVSINDIAIFLKMFQCTIDGARTVFP